MGQNFGVRRIGDWGKARKLLHSLARGKVTEVYLGRITKESATQMQRWTKETLREGRPGWEKLHPITIASKGSTKPMVDSEQMVEGIEVFDFGRLAKEVGWSQGKPRSDGREHDAVANALENGATIEVTPAIRGYFAAMGFPLRATTQVLTIPARPFLQPTFDTHLNDLVEIGKNFLQDMVEFLLR